MLKISKSIFLTGGAGAGGALLIGITIVTTEDVFVHYFLPFSSLLSASISSFLNNILARNIAIN